MRGSRLVTAVIIGLTLTGSPARAGAMGSDWSPQPSPYDPTDEPPSPYQFGPDPPKVYDLGSPPWSQIQDSTDPQAFRDFIKHHPLSIHWNEARDRLRQLEAKP